jgi:hypothetical protein
MMRALGVDATLLAIDRNDYARLQLLVASAIGYSTIRPVEFDDVMWRRLNRSDARNPMIDRDGIVGDPLPSSALTKNDPQLLR